MRFMKINYVWHINSQPCAVAPLQTSQYDNTIPMIVAQEAYKEYSAQYGTSQSLEQLNKRGGFGASEIAILLFERIVRIDSAATRMGTDAMQVTAAADQRIAELEAENKNLRHQLDKVEGWHPPVCTACGDGTGSPCDHEDCPSGRYRGVDTDWADWNGCPIAPVNTSTGTFEFKLRNGQVVDEAKDWSHTGEPDDIIAYRRKAKPEPEKAETGND